MLRPNNEHDVDISKEALQDKKSEVSTPNTTGEGDVKEPIAEKPKDSPKDVATHSDGDHEGIPNPFDLDALRSPPDFQKTGGVRKITLNVRTSSRPPKDKFIRVHPFDETHGQEKWCFNVVVFGHQFDGEIGEENFIVPAGSDAYNLLFEKLKSVLIVCGITPTGSKFLWELKLPTPGNNRRSNQWHETRLNCATRAVDAWIRPEADINAGGYNYAEPLATIPEPAWGGETFQMLLEVAYRDRIINSLDHPVAKEFLGK